MTMDTMMRKALCMVIVDIVCILLVGIPVLLLMLIGDPYYRGFFCDDDTIRHPYKESTVGVPALVVISYGLPLVIICLVETSRLKHSKIFTHSRLGRQVYNVAGVFVFGAFVNHLLTDTSKYTIGRLRPHFIQVCNPNLTKDQCGEVNSPKYVTEFVCQGQDGVSQEVTDQRLHDARLSFVSGHASLSVYSMWFSIVYLQHRMSGRDFRLLKPLIQVGCLLFALFTSLTRVSDYKHHPEDVVGGALLGLVMSTVANMFLDTRLVGRRANTATSTTSLVTVSTSRMHTEELRDASPT